MFPTLSTNLMLESQCFTTSTNEVSRFEDSNGDSSLIKISVSASAFVIETSAMESIDSVSFKVVGTLFSHYAA